MPSSTRPILHYALTFLPPLALVTAVATQPWFEARCAFMDPIVAGEISGDCGRIYYGFISNLGVLYLAASAAVCLFAALCLGPGQDAGARRFLVGAGLVSGWLCLDDLFMIHEGVLPNLGVAQAVTIGVYGALTAAYLVSNRRAILAGRTPMLVLALLCFAASAGIDLVLHSVESHLVWAEDAAKFVGIAAWTGFHLNAALRLVTAAQARAVEPRPRTDLDRRIGELHAVIEEDRRLRAAEMDPRRRVPAAAIVSLGGRR